MTFAWQQSRNAALYVNTENSQIYGRVSWENEDRQQLKSEYLGPSSLNKIPHQPQILGFYTADGAAKTALEAHVAAIFPAQEQTQKAAG